MPGGASGDDKSNDVKRDEIRKDQQDSLDEAKKSIRDRLRQQEDQLGQPPIREGEAEAGGRR
jgi:hypothetical protein